MEIEEKRRTSRVPLGRKAVLIFDQQTKETGKIKDISVAGAGLLLASDRKKGKQCTLAFTLPTHHGTVKCLVRSKIAHCRLQNGLYYIGVVFLGLEESLKKDILAYVEHKLRQV